MPLSYWCVLAAAMLPLVWAGTAKAGGVRRDGRGFDNSAPRDWLARLHGWPRRADWAQQNALEAFPPFAAGVIIAHQLDTAAATVNALAVAFVAARLLHGVFYVADLATLRSLAWLIGFGATVLLFVLSIGPAA